MLVANLIGSTGQPQDGDAHSSSLRTHDVVHPGTGQVVHQMQKSTKADIERAINTAHTAHRTWSATSLKEREAIILRAADLIGTSEWAERLRDANIAETSVTFWWSSTQVSEVPNFLQELVQVAAETLKSEVVSYHGAEIEIAREPYGVCLAIAPWNAAHLLTSRAIVTPLLAGNTVILKTSEHVPYTQTLWAELLYEAGLPRECLSVVHVAPEDAAVLVPELVKDSRVRHVNFTGSTRVGAILAGLAGQYLKPTLMELGGKAPVLLLPDADIVTAASHILFGAFMNAGQLCMSTERVFVCESQYNQLVQALRDSWKTIKLPQARALFTEASARNVRELLKDATTQGASSLLEDDTGCEQAGKAFVLPTILGPGSDAMNLYRDESFGPVALLIKVADEGRDHSEIISEMVEKANETAYGLTAAVWSRDLDKAKSVARRLECGAVHINAPANGDPPNVPHGGWKSSGWGRFNGAEGLRGFTQTRSMEYRAQPGPLPLNVFEL